MRFTFILLGIAVAAGGIALLAGLAGFPEVGIVIAGVVGAFLAAVVVGMPGSVRICQQCGSVLPGFRKASSLTQMLKGGWNCPNCRTEVDRNGYPVH